MWQPAYGFNVGVSGYQAWQAAYVYGGMMQAALRGNSDARNFISSMDEASSIASVTIRR